MTTIGAAPSASMVIGFSVEWAGQLRQPTSAQAKTRPKVGEASSKAGISAGTSDGETPDGSSRQLIAGSASMKLSA